MLKRLKFLGKLRPKNRKTTLLVLVFVVVILGFAGWGLVGNKFSPGKELYAQSAGHKIYEDEVRDLLGDKNPDITDREAATVLADKYLTEALAEEQGISLSEQEIETEYGPSVKKQKANNKYAYQNKVNQLYFNKLMANNKGIYKGKLLVAHFSRFVEFKSPLLEEQKSLEPRMGNPSAIAKDKKYAKDLLTRLYGDIKSGKISFDEAIKTEHNDPVVGQKAYSSLPHSGKFDNSLVFDNLLETDSALRKIRAMRPGEISEPFVVEVPDSFGGTSTAESYFLVVRLDESSGGDNAGLDFEQYLSEAKQRLGYEIYV